MDRFAFKQHRLLAPQSPDQKPDIAMSDFYVTLPSNTKGVNNRTSAFRCALPQTIELEGEWECGLSELQYPFSWNNVANCYIDIEVFDYLTATDTRHPRERKGLKFRVEVEDGNYEDIHELIRGLNSALYKFWLARMEEVNRLVKKRTKSIALSEIHTTMINGRPVSINYPKTEDMLKEKPLVDNYNYLYAANGTNALLFNTIIGDEKVITTMDKDFVFNFEINSNLRHLLGYRDQKDPLGVAPYPFSLMSPVRMIYLYCPLIEYQFIGDIKAPVLRTIPVNGKVGDYIDVSYVSPHYVNLLSRRFDAIEIYLRSDTGELIHFNDNRKVVATLHFRRKRRNIPL